MNAYLYLPFFLFLLNVRIYRSAWKLIGFFYKQTSLCKMVRYRSHGDEDYGETTAYHLTTCETTQPRRVTVW